MARCPNCNFELVYLEKRRKFKCPKCAKVFPEKEINLNEFHQTSKREREKDREELEKSIKEERHAKRMVSQLKKELRPKKQPSPEKLEKIRADSRVREKKWRTENRTLSQINFLRLSQKRLAVKMWENGAESVCGVKIKDCLPSLLLS